MGEGRDDGGGRKEARNNEPTTYVAGFRAQGSDNSEACDLEVTPRRH